MIPAGVGIFVCTTPIDFRQGFDRLAQTARDVRARAIQPMSCHALS
jgi:hypothetical protein